ncbi:hypothetical protein [Rhizobium phage RHph_X3_2]|nr:hypothetical protein [Rhizobium phage RHph_X3_2]
MVYKLREGTHETNAASEALGEALNRWFTDFGPSPIFRTCESCRFMARGGPAFCQRYNMTPPVEVIMAGCDAYEDQGQLPFFENSTVPMR